LVWASSNCAKRFECGAFTAAFVVAVLSDYSILTATFEMQLPKIPHATVDVAPEILCSGLFPAGCVIGKRCVERAKLLLEKGGVMRQLVSR
jgi:hypothetical protein